MANKKATRKKAAKKEKVTLYYKEQELFYKASPEVPSVTSFPLDGKEELLATSERNSVQPGGTVTWYLNGPTRDFLPRYPLKGTGGTLTELVQRTRLPPERYPPRVERYREVTRRIWSKRFGAGEVCGQIKDNTVMGGQTFINHITVADLPPLIVPLVKLESTE